MQTLASSSHGAATSTRDGEPVCVDGPLAVRCLMWSRIPGEVTCTVIAKATFALAPGECPLIATPEPVLETDEHWEGDARRSVRTPSDWTPFKPAPEAMLSGSAFSEAGAATTSVRARWIVGPIDKTIEAWAPRGFDGSGEIAIRGRQSIFPLAWEHAAGGSDSDNPVGVECNHDGAVPSLQPAGFALRRASDYVPSVGFGPIGRDWPARNRSVRPEHRAWVQRGYGGSMPAGFDPKWLQAAPSDQRFDGPLASDARMILEGLHRDHARLVTNLPGLEPRLFVWSPHERVLKMTADSLHVDTDRLRVTMTWRDSFTLHRGAIATVTLRRAADVVPYEEVRRLRELHTARSVVHQGDTVDERTAAPSTAPASSALLPFRRRSDTSPVPPPTSSPSSLRGRPVDPFEVTPIQPALTPPATTPSRPSPPMPRPSSPAPSPAMPIATAAPFAAPPLAPPPASVAPPPPPSPSAPFHAPPPMPAPPALVSSMPSTSSAMPMFRDQQAPPPAFAAPSKLDASAKPPAAAPAKREDPAFSVAFGGRSRAIDPEPREAEPVRAAARPNASRSSGSRKVLVEVLHVDDGAIARLSRDPDLRDAFHAITLPASRGVDLAQDDAAERDRMRLLRFLSSQAPTEGHELREVMARRLAGPECYELPLLTIECELKPSFDEVEQLRATISIARAVAGADKRVAAVVQSSAEQLDGALPPTGDMAAALTRQIEQSMQQLSLPARYLERAVERALFEGRRFKKREVFGKSHLRVDIALGSGVKLPAYVDGSVASRLPLLPGFPAIALGTLRPREDAAEADKEAFAILALARRLDPRADRDHE